MRIILDFGSGNTCRNDQDTIVRMYDALRKVDTGRHDVVVKWQLFEKAGSNIPLRQEVFDFAYLYGQKLGYAVTASAFDLGSMLFLLQYDIPFVKIANRPDLYWLMGEVPRKIPIYVSGNKEFLSFPFSVCNSVRLACISKYPASFEDYDKEFGTHLCHAVSDHTPDFYLFRRVRPDIIEWHYKLPDSTGLDAGPFARTPTQLKEVL